MWRTVHRTWGWYFTLIRTPWFAAKILAFGPRHELSGQYHYHRSEWWFYLWAPDGQMELGQTPEQDQPRSVQKVKGFGQSSFTKPLQYHKFTNFAARKTYVLEIQWGRVKEADIIRFDKGGKLPS